MLHELEHPLLRYRIKESPNVRIQYVVHVLHRERVRERVQRLMLAASRSKPIREAQKVLLVNRVEDGDHGLLDNLVLQPRNPQRTLAPVAFRDIHPSRWLRPIRSQHQALDALSYALTVKHVNYVLDADIRGFFDSISHEWMLQFVQHRVADRRILRLIQKWLKAGVMEEGKWTETEMGTPQGAVISPLLANIYLHYVFDLWVQAWRKKHARGDVVVVRYADDMVLGFQLQAEADRFLEDFRERLGKFGLELHPDKTRRIEFGPFAELYRKRRGEGKPETFDFLGFTHISGKNRRGQFTVKRKTISQRLRGKLRELKQQLRQRRHDPMAQTGKWLRSVVQGYFNYHAVPGNLDRLRLFRDRLTRLWRTQLRQRSQRHRLNWKRLHQLAARWLPVPHVLHPWPSERFAATHPR